jgi:hypothetical protein
MIDSAGDNQFLRPRLSVHNKHTSIKLTMVFLNGKTIVCSFVPKSAFVVALLARIASRVGNEGDSYCQVQSVR